MNEIRKVKLKTGMQVASARLWKYGFNRRMKGVKAAYNLGYRPDGLKQHTLDVMYPRRGKNGQSGEGGLPCVIYSHGGGWSAYDKSIFRSTTKALASQGAVVFNCNFRLAPEYGFDDMEEDVAAVVEFVTAHAAEYGGDPEKIILAGDSSGAHLLSLYINRLVAGGGDPGKRFIGCAFFYGVYDLTALDGVPFNNKKGYTDAALPTDMPNRDLFLSRYSPISYLSPQIPPTLMCSGMTDNLHEGQTAVYERALRQTGVRVETLVFPKDYKRAAHRFMTFVDNPATKLSLAKFKEFINSLEK